MNTYSNIIIHPLSSATQEKQFLLSYNGLYYEANLPIVELIKELQKYPTEEEAISSYILQKNEKYTLEQIREIINKFITPLFANKEKKRTFLYEKELFTASAIDRFSDMSSFLFNKVYLCTTFILALVLECYFFFNTNDILVFNNKVNVYTVLGLFIFMLASSFFHELGHAAACKHFGIKHGGIGFGLYLNFPVLYTDVTEVWKLKRKERCVVNIAGIYFQSFCLIGLLTGFFLTENGMLRYMILIMNLGFLMTLNPFFKFDGYWIASDLLGVPNLRTRSMELISYLYKRICKRVVATKPYLLQLRMAEKLGLAIYSIVVNFFMGYYFFYIIPMFIYNFACSFPAEMEQLILYISNSMAPPFALLRNIGMQLIFLGLIAYFLINLLRPIIKRYFRHA